MDVKMVELGYEILRFPEKEEGLKFLERVTREAYGSTDKIHDGTVPCKKCNGTGSVCLRSSSINISPCLACSMTGRIKVKEPSYVNLLGKRVFKTDRRRRLTRKVQKLVQSLTLNEYPEEFIARALVDGIIDDIVWDPPHNGVGDHLHATVMCHAGRGFSHQAVRHRVGVGLLQRSTRHVGGGKGGIEVVCRGSNDFQKGDESFSLWLETMQQLQKSYEKLSRAESNDMARGILPIDTYAPLIITGSFTYWRHFFRMRCSEHAHPDMHAIARPLWEEFKQRMPIVFDELI